MTDLRWSRGAACGVASAERLTRGAAAVVAAAFASAFAAAGQTWCAVPAAACAVMLAIGAVTGWCPTSLMSSRRTERPVINSMSQPDARDFVGLGMSVTGGADRGRSED